MGAMILQPFGPSVGQHSRVVFPASTRQLLLGPQQKSDGRPELGHDVKLVAAQVEDWRSKRLFGCIAFAFERYTATSSSSTDIRIRLILLIVPSPALLVDENPQKE